MPAHRLAHASDSRTCSRACAGVQVLQDQLEYGREDHVAWVDGPGRELLDLDRTAILGDAHSDEMWEMERAAQLTLFDRCAPLCLCPALLPRPALLPCTTALHSCPALLPCTPAQHSCPAKGSRLHLPPSGPAQHCCPALLPYQRAST